MLEEIKYPRTLNFLGRNGYFLCAGLTVIAKTHGPENENYVCLVPQTSRGRDGRCMIDVPMESVDKLIELLQKAKVRT